METKRKLFFIEGNISSGKSSLLELLMERGVVVFQEPIHIWKEHYVEKNGDNILGLFYSNMKRWSFQFEVAVMNTRFKNIMKALNSNHNLMIIERSLLTDMKVFAPNLYAMNEMTDMEWKIYCDWYETFMELIEERLKQVDVQFIYIKTDPEICFERKLQRDRTEEKDVIPDYFISLHERHEKWLNDVDSDHKVHIIDGNQNRINVYNNTINLLFRGKSIENTKTLYDHLLDDVTK